MSRFPTPQCVGPGVLEVENLPPAYDLAVNNCRSFSGGLKSYYPHHLEDRESLMADDEASDSVERSEMTSSDGSVNSMFMSDFIGDATWPIAVNASEDKGSSSFPREAPLHSAAKNSSDSEYNSSAADVTLRSSSPNVSLRFPKLTRNGNRVGSFNTSAGSSMTCPTMGPAITISVDEKADSHISARLSHDSKKEGQVRFKETDQNDSAHSILLDPAFFGRQTSTIVVSSAVQVRDQIVSFFQPADNKLALKLFGNKSALLKEKRRQQAVGNWVIHPCSNFRFYWDFFMLLVLITNLITLPIAISFFNDDLSIHWIVFNCISDTVFLVDIIINFRTGVIMNDIGDEILLDPKQIAVQYLKTWFVLDLISSIPMDYIFLMIDADNSAPDVTQLIHAGRAFRMLRLAKLLSLLRLLRLSRLVRYVGQAEAFFNFAGMFIRIFNLIGFMLLISHWSGCLQFLVPMLEDFPPNSWIAINELQNAPWWQQYTWALFKALSHMLCIGYGRFPPQSITDVWLTMVSMLIGAICYALFVGHATTLIQSFDTSKRLYRDKIKQVEEYMSYRKFPPDLRQKITDYFEYRYQGKMFDEENIMKELSECLREHIVNFNCRPLVAAVPFFTHADPNFVSEVVSKLKYKVFQPGDIIIKEGTIGTKMYFIQEGIVDIITKEGDVATSLSDGSYFGEICLLTNAKRVASVKAETYCNMFSLAAEHFNAVLKHYPVMRRTMETVAAERLTKIGRDPNIFSRSPEDSDEEATTGWPFKIVSIGNLAVEGGKNGKFGPDQNSQRTSSNTSGMTSANEMQASKDINSSSEKCADSKPVENMDDSPDTCTVVHENTKA
ncbi:potassium/sodium hyperpolarization-activated cyclic nucleotide-gated channel 3-like [Lineus longissimus]|uniref:potassium/sodium hyperpolarization-activated cyclic nucleotide-gated channel 3-like n=1 Tax=Lineus longissimus TaxID=88925 RepID=UPI00315CBFE0